MLFRCISRTAAIALLLCVSISTACLAAQPATLPAAKLPRTVARGEIITADTIAGGFTAESPTTAEIDLSWPAVRDVRRYILLRGTGPKFKMDWSSASIAEPEENHHDDMEVAPATTYYYAIVALMEDESLQLVATGKATTPAQDGPLIGIPNDEPATKPATRPKK